MLLVVLLGVLALLAVWAIGSYNRLVGLRVDVEDEDTGLDLTQHGERAYTE